MSYILDALRKADAQRERDPARGIHAQSLHPPAGVPRGELAQRPWFWIASAAGVAALAAASWYLLRDHGRVVPAPGEPMTAQVARAQVAPAPSIQLPAAAASAAPPAQVVLPPPAPAAVERPRVGGPGRMERTPGAVPRPLVSARMAMPGVQGAAGGQGAQAGSMTPHVELAPPGAPQGPSGMAPPAPALGPASPAPPMPPVAGLPPDAPKLTITGGVYSASRAQRMVIINGQVFREGADLGGGLALEEIRAKSIVLRFRGARYSAGY